MSTSRRTTAAIVDAYTTPPIVRVETIELATPGPNEVLIRVEAASLNALDWHLFTGTPYIARLSNGLRRPKRPTPGADVAGVVEAIGSAVADLAVGDRVFGEIPVGGCATYTVTPADRVVPIPASVDPVDAAATPVAGLTALQGLITKGSLQAGERVLINGAAGGVGTFAVQIAKASGGEVTAVCSTANTAMVKRLGADRVADYTKDDPVEMYRARGVTFDLILDNVGNRTPAEMRSLLTENGRYVIVSGPKSNKTFGPIGHGVRSLLHFARRSQRAVMFVANPNRVDLTTLANMLADGTLAPEIHDRIGLDDVGAAIARLGGGHTPAKIVVIP